MSESLYSFHDDGRLELYVRRYPNRGLLIGILPEYGPGEATWLTKEEARKLAKALKKAAKK